MKTTANTPDLTAFGNACEYDGYIEIIESWDAEYEDYHITKDEITLCQCVEGRSHKTPLHFACNSDKAKKIQQFVRESGYEGYVHYVIDL